MVSADGGRVGSGSLATALSWGSLGVVVLAMLYLAGRPLDTGDLWWHLSLGEVWSQQGPWVDVDPLVHTALPTAPSPHEWLFQVSVHAVDRTLGFAGLRGLHVLLVAATLALVYSLFLRASASTLAAAVATSAFVLLAWYRLFQLRPDLVSIPACLLLYRLLLESRSPPSNGRTAAAVVLLVIWANAHPLFAIGPALLVAALLGVGLRHLLWRVAAARASGGGPLEEEEGARARRLAVALTIGLVATLLNPRGVDQHLTFLHATSGTSLWVIGDEWMPFNPFSWGHYVGGSVSLPMFVTADAVIALFLGAVVWHTHRFFARPTESNLDDLDPVLLGLGMASLVAMGVSIRFLWMSVFPLLYLVHSLRVLVRESPRWGTLTARGLVTAGLAIAVAYPSSAGFRREASRPEGYLSTPYTWQGYSVEAVRFLRDTGVEGNLFNSYGMGGFLGYWLAPRLRVYLDGRIESPVEVMREYAFINGQRVGREGQSFLQLLEMRQVDFFLGSGLPSGPNRVNKAFYTTSHLESVPGWILVFRSYDHAVYARRSRRNVDNLHRIAEYYRAQGVPFDPKRGLDVPDLIDAQPGWAISRGLLPTRYLAHRAQAKKGVGEQRIRALNYLGLAAALAGDYRRGVEHEQRLLALAPDSKASRRRLVFDLMHLRRAESAEEAARQLVALDPGDTRSRTFLALAERGRQVLASGDVARNFAFERAVSALPLVRGRANRDALDARYFAPEPL